jgi:hypothetical protein
MKSFRGMQSFHVVAARGAAARPRAGRAGRPGVRGGPGPRGRRSADGTGARREGSVTVRLSARRTVAGRHTGYRSSVTPLSHGSSVTPLRWFAKWFRPMAVDARSVLARAPRHTPAHAGIPGSTRYPQESLAG